MTSASLSDDPAADRPFHRFLGVRTEEGQPPGHARLYLKHRAEFANSRGELHGGVVASLLDAALGACVRSALKPGEGVSTVSLTVNFLQAGKGDLIASGRVVRLGRTIASAEVTIVDPEGEVVAHGVGSMRIIAARATHRAGHATG